MVTSETRFSAFKKMGAVAVLSLGLLVSHSLPAVAQFLPLRAWGAGDSGEMGNGEYYSSFSAPQMVNVNSSVTQISAGGEHAMALASDGTVWAWGNNSAGQLGNSMPYYTGNPMQIVNFGDVSQISAGGDFSLALKNDGSVWAWGSNYSGSLGHGGFDNDKHDTPSVVKLLFSITEVSANGHGMALDAYGYVYTWGFNLYGELGTGDTTSYAYASMVQGIDNVRHIAAGEYHSLALKNDGTVWAWGHNDTAQLGDGTTTDRYTPVQVIGLNHVVAIAASNACSIALKDDGTVWYWGFFYGFSSAGTYTRTPVQMTELGNHITKIALGDAHILAVDNQGRVLAIGDNTYGQIGDPRAGVYQYPARVLDNLYNITAVSAGPDYSMAQTNAASISGNVHLEGISDTAGIQYLTLVFRAPGQQDIIRGATASADAFVQVDDLPRANYSIAIKGAKWLQRVVNIDLTYANSTDLDVTLPAGDANNDNSVDVADFGVLVNAYGSAYDPNASNNGFDIRADFNCDGVVDIDDFSLLVNNYGGLGDP